MCITTRLVAFDAEADAIEPSRPGLLTTVWISVPFLTTTKLSCTESLPAIEVDRSCSRAIRIDGISATAGVPLHRRRSSINNNVVYLTQMAFAVKVSHRYATEHTDL